METFYGVVEDRHDPMMVGRVRVRIHGLHSEEKTQISTPDLPWSTVILPTTSAGLTGFGTQHGLVEGSSVYGFFRDGKSQQDPVITGVVAGIPVQGYKKDANGNLIKRKVTIGFSDPRRLTTSEYTGTPDGTTPSHNPRRTYGLTASLEDAPQIPDERETPLNYGPWEKKKDETGIAAIASKIVDAVLGKTTQQTGNVITEPTKTQEDDKPYYPYYTDAPDYSPYARGEGDYTDRDFGFKGSNMSYVSKADPKYPYNKTVFTESGHLLELDDTLGAERVSVAHRSGTFHSIEPDGSEMTRIVNDRYTVVCKNDEVYIGGNVNVKIMGNADIKTFGDVNLKGYGKGTLDFTNDVEIKAGGNMTLSSAKKLKLSAQVIES